MSHQSPSRDSARRAGIWVVALIVLAAVAVGVYYLAQSVPAVPTGTVAAINERDHVSGKGDVVFIEYADFQCPACQTYYPMVKQVKQDFSDRVQVVYRNFPLTQHQNADGAARAAEAAAKQEKFWEMHDRLFEGQASWAEERNAEIVFESYARDLNLNIDQYKKQPRSGQKSYHQKTNNDSHI